MAIDPQTNSVPSAIATILHRSTLAALVGTRTFDRGESCFTEGRVLATRSSRGELRGTVRPAEPARAPYSVRIWVRADGIAVACTCPMGEQQQFCKHAVAVALAHLTKERAAGTLPPSPSLADRLRAADPERLAAALADCAAADPGVHALLARVLDELEKLDGRR